MYSTEESNRDEFEGVEDFLRPKNVEGYVIHPWKEILHWLVALCTGFISLLLAYWFQRKYIPLRYRRVPLEQAAFVLIEGMTNGFEFVRVERVKQTADKFLYPEAWFPPREGVQDIALEDRMIVFRNTRFFFDTRRLNFRMCQYPTQIEPIQLSELQQSGLTSRAHEMLLTRFGRNEAIVLVLSIPALLLQEILHPFFVFQVYSIILWCFEEYYPFAGAIGFIVIVSVVTTLISTRAHLKRIADLARHETNVRVLRNGEVIEVSSTSLVPGDVLVLDRCGTVPCDVALLRGGCVVNESMLTGESVPVSKYAVDVPEGSREPFQVGQDQRCTVFAATNIVQLKPASAQDPVLGLVVRTGYATSKGSLILSILFPKPSFFRFAQQSLQFVGVLACLAAVGFALTVWQLSGFHAETSEIVIRGGDLITVVVPPSLPLAMSVGTNFALACLRRLQVFCISPSRINMAGKVKVMCFDKTGTLTSDGMDVVGVAEAEQGRLKPPAEQPSQLSEMTLLCLASCHSLAVLESDHKGQRDDVAIDPRDGGLIGDPLDIRMFCHTGARLSDRLEMKDAVAIVTLPATLSSTRLRVIQQFPFQSALERMSVLTTPMGSDAVTAFVKGSPEKIASLCRPGTLPSNYTDQVYQYGRKGYRVIALAYKSLGSESNLPPRSDLVQMRLLAEAELTFAGLLLFENKLKEETVSTLHQLTEAGIRSVMVTGDHPVTAVTVAREAGLVSEGTDIYISRLSTDEQGHPYVAWHNTHEDGVTLDPYTLKGHMSARYELAVTGDCFRFLSENRAQLSEDAPLSHHVHREDPAMPESFFHKVLVSAVVFARMSPDQKALLVAQLQSMGLYVGMCGDGANDCGALKTAHVGISLSEAEASIAAPFTYLKPNISCVPLLLAEGRASLITSFQLFRFMAMYSMIQFGAAIHCSFNGSLLGNWQYLFQDLWVVFPLTILMGWTPANHTLTRKRPSGNLLSAANLLNLLGHITICIAFQVTSVLWSRRQPEYEPHATNEPNDSDIWETTSVYYTSSCQYLVISLLFSLGRPWKQYVYKNIGFSAWWVLACLSCVLLVLASNLHPTFFMFEEDVDLPVQWRWKLFWLFLINSGVNIIWELAVFPLLNALCKSRSGKLRTNTVFGPGGRKSTGAKIFHELRRDFEDGWSLYMRAPSRINSTSSSSSSSRFEALPEEEEQHRGGVSETRLL